ncbi:MAG TPA: phosphoenolpyruvate carboxykinase (ATP) [Anaerolineales bacterium]|nr:phosphoenolpyruvate carboxykinase (ATP) [Anaerolineales bacterium]
MRISYPVNELRNTNYGVRTTLYDIPESRRRIPVTEFDHKQNLAQVLQRHPNVLYNPSRQQMIQAAVDHREALVAANGALATWTPPESTGRSPKDTYIVRHPTSEENIDWDSPNNIPMEPETFDMLWEDALATLSGKPRLYITDRVVGADVSYALPVRVVSYWALTALFTDNMFRPVPEDIERSIFARRGFTLLVCPYDKLNRTRYEGRLRKLPDGQTSDMAVAMDFDRMLGVVYGSAYGGSVKKLIFTVMNYVLPGEGILPLHCSANEGPEGACALLLGLSGTGKTTLSADPRRALLGDDEHGWSDNGIANFENGCYAKLINLRQEKEPEIWHAVFHEAPYLEHGAIVENCMMYPWGVFDVDDERFTPNSRASYPLRFLTNVKPDSRSGHPRTILFLAADANGVLPPVAKLTPEQAMLWFLMGYTSKLAGTETGIVDPVSTFSRFFGEPFMPRNPDVYARMLGERMRKHGSQVYLVNTGWSGGPFGVGARMDIHLTREIVNAALSGQLEDVEYVEDMTFHILIPKRCPGVPSEVLFPRNTWADKEAYDARARKLARDFSDHFDRAYGDKNIAPAVVTQCPGK